LTDGFLDTSDNGVYNTDLTVSVTDGILDKWIRTINGQPTTAAITPVINGSSTEGQLYGRYEVRFRSEIVTGYKMAWLLWPASGIWNEGEVDFPEGSLGQEITGFSHEVGPNPANNVLAVDTGVTMQDWHTATIEWRPDSVTFFLDGQEVGRTTDPTGIPSTPMYWVLQTETELTGPLPPVDEEGHVQIDYVRAWSWTEI
jgi:beta-glucanase (GH16 family)